MIKGDYKDIEWYIDEKECWICISHCKSKDGYPLIRRNDKTISIARAMMEVKYNKELSSEIMVLHSCDNPTCINPNHLRIGTAKDNAQDREKRGRHGSTDGAGTPPKYDDST